MTRHDVTQAWTEEERALREAMERNGRLYYSERQLWTQFPIFRPVLERLARVRAENERLKSQGGA